MLAFTAIHRQLYGVSVGAVERLIAVQKCLHPILTRRDEVQAAQRIAQDCSVKDRVGFRFEAVDVDAEDELTVWPVVDLESRLLGVIL